MITAKLLLAYFLSTSNFVGVNIDTSKVDPEEAYCMAENIYYEARNEDIQGQFAVASVTLNRAKDVRYPDTVCGVVRQSTISKVGKNLVCAFSWYCEKDKKGKEISLKNRDGSVNQQVVNQFQVASIIAITVLSGNAKDNTHGATHFHNPYISQPAWSKELTRTARYGNHDFYKLPSAK